VVQLLQFLLYGGSQVTTSLCQSWFNDFYQRIAKSPLSHWLQTLPAELAHWQNQQLHGDFAKWIRLLEALPVIACDDIELKNSVSIGQSGDIDPNTEQHIRQILKQFKPWRKGPFHLHGIHIDTEWRSDWKWDRVLPHISDLEGRYVLDVGCGSGYHLWRMLGAGAKCAVGIDPSQLFLIQFQAIKHFHPHPDAHLLPLGIEQLPALNGFDTVFSMGVLYHRRSPIDFLQQLKDQLKPGGELILETLVIEGDKKSVLMPDDRYAQMRNMWFLPSVDTLTLWLQRLGYADIRLVDLNHTSTEEQRKTDWMTGQSLADFLDPNSPDKTIEGYPAPLRAIMIANKPS
jgi:tRNA (mo5U34)-methyltransferase